MKIAFDAKRCFHNLRGLGNYSRDTIRVLSTYYPDNEYLLFNPKEEGGIDFRINPKNTRIITPTRWIDKQIPAYWRSYGLRRELMPIKADIFHGLSQELPFGIRQATSKTVVTVHDAIFMRYPSLYPLSYRKIFIAKNRYAFRTADKIIAISHQTKQDIIRFFGVNEKKIEVIYQGCNDLFKQPITAEQKEEVRKKYQLPPHYLLSVGAIEERKNISLIIKALHSQKVELPLVIVGRKTKYQQVLNTLVQRLNLSHSILFRHHVESSDLPALYANAEIFIFPSIFEGFGIPILEALTVGTPVICSAGSCFEETGGDSSCYIDPHSETELGKAIHRLLANPQLMETMRIKGQEHSRRFDDKEIAQQLITLYENILSQ